MAHICVPACNCRRSSQADRLRGLLRSTKRAKAALQEPGASPAIPLDRARFCLDCGSTHMEAHCPACGSAAFHPLEKWLNRKQSTCKVLEFRQVDSRVYVEVQR